MTVVYRGGVFTDEPLEVFPDENDIGSDWLEENGFLPIESYPMLDIYQQGENRLFYVFVGSGVIAGFAIQDESSFAHFLCNVACGHILAESLFKMVFDIHRALNKKAGE